MIRRLLHWLFASPPPWRQPRRQPRPEPPPAPPLAHESFSDYCKRTTRTVCRHCGCTRVGRYCARCGASRESNTVVAEHWSERRLDLGPRPTAVRVFEVLAAPSAGEDEAKSATELPREGDTHPLHAGLFAMRPAAKRIGLGQWRVTVRYIQRNIKIQVSSSADHWQKLASTLTEMRKADWSSVNVTTTVP